MIQVIMRKEVEMATMNIRPDGSIREALLNRLVVIYRNDGYRVLWIQKMLHLVPEINESIYYLSSRTMTGS